MVSTCLAGAASAEPAHRWDTYGNTRYGFTMCYPADLFRAGAEPQARDGVVFAGPAGTRLVTSGGYDVDNSTPASEVEDEAKASAGQSARITYRAGHGSWAVVSGTAGTNLFYARRAKTKDVMAGFQFVYPARDATRYAQIVSRMNACFSVTP